MNINLIIKTNFQLKKQDILWKSQLKLNFTKFSFQCTSLDSTLDITFHQNGGRGKTGS